jgi:energy-coupling factor transporter transmembrane protein EcfT
VSSRLSFGPLSILAACLLPVAGALAVSTVTVGLVVLGAQLLVFGGLARDLPATGRRLLIGAVAAVSIMVSTWLYGGHHESASLAAALRVLTIVTPAALLSPRIGPSELGDHLGQRLHLPARAVVAAVAALQRLDSIGTQRQQVHRARRARGLGSDGGPGRRVRGSAGGAFALLVVSMRHTGQLATAMDARGFEDAGERTWAEPAPWLPGDWLLASVALASAVLPWLLR